MKNKKRAESRVRYFVRDVAAKRGWDVAHVAKNGDFLEEQEIVDMFPDIGLDAARPDFLLCHKSLPMMIIEAKNDFRKINQAIDEATGYADTINRAGRYTIKLAVGVAIGFAGEDDNGHQVVVRYLTDSGWQLLKSRAYELSTIPSKREVELALQADDANTTVSIPSSSEFIEAAIAISSILRSAKIEAPLRPKVIGAIITALYQGEIELSQGKELESINSLVEAAISESIDLDEGKKRRLEDALKMTGNDYDRLAPKIKRLVSLLKQLNIRSVLQTDTDFLGLLYEAFLRYGYDNNALGIVFTPRHITKLCVDLVDAGMSDRVIDIASGTGGFLVSAFDKMMSTAKGPKAVEKIKQSLYGFDTNPTVWALATLNMFFRGDGKSHIENGDCFDEHNRENIRGKFTRAFLNPPFSQENELERDFIDAAMDALEPGGMLACVVKAGIFADAENAMWRAVFIKKHSLVAVISLPEELFYPTAAPTSILIAKAHIPMDDESPVFMARIWNDGFEKLKGKRIHCEGSQIPEIIRCFRAFQKKAKFTSPIATTIKGQRVLAGQEFSPQQWLEQPKMTEAELLSVKKSLLMSIFQTVTAMPEIAGEVLEHFPLINTALKPLPLNTNKPLSHFFEVHNGKSFGEKNYTVGSCPYISSGDMFNSVVRLVSDEPGEVFEAGGITVTAFGQAYVQPWRFMARGNGGSSVRVLIPKYKMSLNELCWFATQINIQRWRFFYGRMAIKARLSELLIASPPDLLPDFGEAIFARIVALKTKLNELGDL